jgi:phosphoenolpyruvate-protein phosphotransferase (PTS system enzyme I)
VAASVSDAAIFVSKWNPLRFTAGVAEDETDEEVILRGIPVSRGVCVGNVMLLGRQNPNIREEYVEPAEAHLQIERLEQALVETRAQLHDIHARVSIAMGATDAGIFDAHLLVLDDPSLLDQVAAMINGDAVTAEYAFHTIGGRFADTLASVDDEYLSERVSDLRDVTHRVLNNLMGVKAEEDLGELTEPRIIISHDLAPSTTAVLDTKKVLGFGTEVGGKTSHTAILARSLRLPAVVGLTKIVSRLESGQRVLLDGYDGIVILNPSQKTLEKYGQLEKQQQRVEDRLREIQRLPSVTLDGHAVTISANVEEVEDAVEVIESGAEGVGLFRTEYLFLNRKTLPNEEEQFEAYREAARRLKPHPVIIRTLDVGGDKLPLHLDMDLDAPEMNPFLGWRAIRFCLEENTIFRTQLRAILRASVEGNIRLMYPMISGVEELTESNRRLDLYREELRAEGHDFDPNIKIGAMIEVPSAVMVADVLAKRVDFFSIGTNDLIQYALAADRMNEKVAHLYAPTHPGILRLIKMTVDAGHRNGVEVGVCGEMAGDPAMAPLLLGLGVDELSATPPLVPQLKYMVRRMSMSEARELARAALGCESSEEVLIRCQEIAECLAPELFARR